MEPQVTVGIAPVKIRIADAVRLDIERGKLTPGDPVPTLKELADQWQCSISVAREGIDLLKQQGLIVGGRGKAAHVAPRAIRVVRSSDRHQAEKDLVRQSEAIRRGSGLSEMDMDTPIADLDFKTSYEIVQAPADIARALAIPPESEVLRRIFDHRDNSTGKRRSFSISYLPAELIRTNPAILDSANEPWPGGTQHQLYTVGIEIACVVDEVTSRMPTTPEVRAWGLRDGIPLIVVRRTSIDTDDRPVEVSDADFPADTTELKFTTHLKRW